MAESGIRTLRISVSISIIFDKLNKLGVGAPLSHELITLTLPYSIWRRISDSNRDTLSGYWWISSPLPYQLGLIRQTWYSGWDSNPHFIDPKSIACCQLGYRSLLNLMSLPFRHTDILRNVPYTYRDVPISNSTISEQVHQIHNARL